MITEALLKYLTDLPSKSPILILGEAAKIFKNNYSKTVITPFNMINFEEYVLNYDYTSSELIVIDLFSFSLNSRILDEFMNRLKSPIILLSEDAHLSIEELSKVKSIFKMNYKAKSSKLDASKALSDIKFYEGSTLKYYAEESPELYYLRNKTQMTKYIELLSAS